MTSEATMATQDDSAGTLASRAGRGARWVALQNFGKQGVDLGVFLLLAKLLAPAAFGVVAMAGALVVLVNSLAEMGLGDALVQRRDLQPGQINAAFWSALCVGLGCACLAWIFAPGIARLYKEPQVAQLLRALSPLFIIQSLAVVPQAMLQRSLAFRQLALRSIAGSVLGGLTGVILAFKGVGPWSLVAQQLTSGTIGLLGLYVMNVWRPSLKWRFQDARELLLFGRSVLGARFLNVAASKADDLIVGLVLGPAALGVYTVACRMLLALEQLFVQGVDALALAAFSRVAEQYDKVRDLFLAASRAAAVLAAPIFCGIAVLAPELIKLGLGDRWLASAPVLQVLLLAGFVHSLMHFNHAVFKACGYPGWSMRVAALSTGLNVVTLLVAVQFGVIAVAVSYFVRSALIAPVGLQMAARLLSLPLRRYLMALRAPIVAVAIAAVTVVLARDVLQVRVALLPEVLMCATLGLFMYAACLRLGAPGTLSRVLGIRQAFQT